MIQLSDLGLPPPPADARPAAPRGEPQSLEDVEKQHISEVLLWSRGNVTQAARILGIDRMTLYNKIKRYGLRRSEEAETPTSSSR